MVKVSDKLKAGIEEYTGRKAKSIQVFADPKVAGTYAARAEMEKGDTIDFLVVGRDLPSGWAKATPEEVAELVEESQFEQWPPKVGAPRFFW